MIDARQDTLVEQADAIICGASNEDRTASEVKPRLC